METTLVYHNQMGSAIRCLLKLLCVSKYWGTNESNARDYALVRALRTGYDGRTDYELGLTDETAYLHE